jgi:hypothetical protein
VARLVVLDLPQHLPFLARLLLALALLDRVHLLDARRRVPAMRDRRRRVRRLHLVFVREVKEPLRPREGLRDERVGHTVADKGGKAESVASIAEIARGLELGIGITAVREG